MEKTRYQKIINYDFELYQKILTLTKKRNIKRKLYKYINKIFKLKKSFKIVEINKEPILNKIKLFLNVDDKEFETLLKDFDIKSQTIEPLQNEQEADNFWSSDIIKSWLVKNVDCQLKNTVIYSFMVNYFQNKKIKLLDYACGTATLSFGLLEKLDIEQLDLFELDNYVGDYLKQNTSEKIRYFDVKKDKLNKEYDAILCIDVLEHLTNSTETLINFHNSLKKEGILALHAPFELDDFTHLPEAADDFFNNGGYQFLNQNFKMIYDFKNDFLVSAIYQKR